MSVEDDVGTVLFGTTLLASFLGGVVALFAPCCVSVMLPAYLATGLRRRGGVLAATVVFGTGVATVIVPIGLGANAIAAAIARQHEGVFLVGAALMVLGGIAVLAGWSPHLPMPAGRNPSGSGVAATYGLGVFSGAASSCCAPVLAGVAVLSGAAGSFPAALAVSAAYVAGIITPLCVLALLWDAHGGLASRVLHRREVVLRLGRHVRKVSLGSLLSGLVLIGMGALTAVFALTGPGMSAAGWSVRTSAWLQHAAAVAIRHLGFLPGWAVALVLVAAAALIVHRIRAGARPRDNAPQDPDPQTVSGAACCAESEIEIEMEGKEADTHVQ